jgi:hypothetical protein
VTAANVEGDWRALLNRRKLAIMPDALDDRLNRLEEKVNALEAKAASAKGMAESFGIRISDQLEKLEKRVTALEKNPPKKTQRKLLVNLDVLAGGARETPGAAEARIKRAIKDDLE